MRNKSKNRQMELHQTKSFCTGSNKLKRNTQNQRKISKPSSHPHLQVLMTFYFNPRVIHDTRSFKPFQITQGSCSISFCRLGINTTAVKTGNKSFPTFSSPSPLPAAADARGGSLPAADASGRRRRGSCKIDSSLFVSIHN